MKVDRLIIIQGHCSWDCYWINFNEIGL